MLAKFNMQSSTCGTGSPPFSHPMSHSFELLENLDFFFEHARELARVASAYESHLDKLRHAFPKHATYELSKPRFESPSSDSLPYAVESACDVLRPSESCVETGPDNEEPVAQELEALQIEKEDSCSSIGTSTLGLPFDLERRPRKEKSPPFEPSKLLQTTVQRQISIKDKRKCSEIHGCGQSWPNHREPDGALWPLWSREHSPMASRALVCPTMSRSSSSRLNQAYERHSNLTASRRSNDCGIVLAPSSQYRLAWDAVSFLAIVWDLVTIPLFAFGFNETHVAHVMRFVISFVWTLDMFASCLTGYYHGSYLEMRPHKTVLRYMKSWFVLDAAVLFIDWLTVLTPEDNTLGAVSVARSAKVLRVSRVLHVMTMTRVLRVWPEVEERMSQWIPSFLSVALSIGKLFLIMALYNHFVACGWYAIASIGPNGFSDSWLQLFEESDLSMAYRYVLSSHWAIAQFTPAPNNVHPQNFRERAYALSVVFLGFLWFSSFLGRMAALLSKISISAAERSKQLDLMRRLCHQYKISLELGDRMTSYIQQVTVKSGKVIHLREADVPCLSGLPDATLMDLHAEMYAPFIMKHPLFFRLADAYELFVASVCHQATVDMKLESGGQLFGMHADAMHMFVLAKGAASYYGGEDLDSSSLVGEGEWLSEAALWVRWQHQGNLFATTPCLFVGISVETFHDIAKKDSHGALARCQLYAKAFAAKVVGAWAFSDLMSTIDPDMLEGMVDQAFEAKIRCHPAASCEKNDSKGFALRLAKLFAYSDSSHS